MELKEVTIVKIGKLKTFDGSDFTCVDFTVKTNDSEFPQYISFQSNKEKADNLLKFNKIGDVVDVSFNLRGRSWISPEGETKYFNTIEAWKVFKSSDNQKPEVDASSESLLDMLS